MVEEIDRPTGGLSSEAPELPPTTMYIQVSSDITMVRCKAIWRGVGSYALFEPHRRGTDGRVYFSLSRDLETRTANSNQSDRRMACSRWLMAAIVLDCMRT